MKVDMDDLAGMITDFTGLSHSSQFDLIADQQYNSIYIRTELDVDLTQLNRYILSQTDMPEYCLSYNLVMPRSMLVSGIKFNADLARMLCREHVSRVH